MCKVAGVVKINDKNRADVWIFMQLLGELMSRGNNDGLGYAAFDKAGKLFGERWFVNDMAFKDLSQIRGLNASKMNRIYNFFGDRVLRHEAQSIILHTRAATCAKNIENTHPFVDNMDNPSVAIIHNGMIYNDQVFTKKYSTCDSEVIAHLYADNKVSENLKHLNAFSERMQGWFTVLALTRDPSGRMVMDAFSDSSRLGSYYITELETRVYSTYADDVRRVAQALGFTAVNQEQVNHSSAMRIDVLTGEVLEKTPIETYKQIPVRYEDAGGWSMWDNVTYMDGNFSDEEFRKRWLGS